MATIYQQDEENAQHPADRSGAESTGPLQTVGSAAPAVGGGMATPEKRPQGSGRFTNLQKYIQANQGAGQQIAGQVGKGIKKEIGKEEREAGEYYKNLGSAISGATKVAKEGAKYQQTLKEIGENIGGQTLSKEQQEQMSAQGTKPVRQETGLEGIQQFVQDPGFGQFQNIQAGRGIDEKLLGLRQQQAAREAGQYLDVSQQAEKSLGDEQGRFDLLRKTFGGASRPGYTTGQQRLDQALLAQSGLGGLRQDVSEQLRLAKGNVGQATQAAGQVGGLAAQERALVDQLTGQTSANEQAYMDMLQSYVDPTQASRTKEWEDLMGAVQGYKDAPGPKDLTDVPKDAWGNPLQRWMPGQSTPTQKDPLILQKVTPTTQSGFTADQLGRLGVGRGQSSYNVFGDIEDAYGIADKGATVTSGSQLATQSDVDRYKALAQMANIDPSSQRLAEAGNIGESWKAKEGDDSLTSRIGRADQDFRTQLDQSLANIMTQMSPRTIAESKRPGPTTGPTHVAQSVIRDAQALQNQLSSDAVPTGNKYAGQKGGLPVDESTLNNLLSSYNYLNQSYNLDRSGARAGWNQLLDLMRTRSPGRKI